MACAEASIGKHAPGCNLRSTTGWLAVFTLISIMRANASDLSTKNTFVSYDFARSIVTPEESRTIDVQFYLQSNNLAGYRYNEAVLGSTKPEVRTVAFSNEYVPVSDPQRQELGRRFRNAGVFELKSDPRDDTKREFSRIDIRIGDRDQRFWFNTPPPPGLRTKIHEIIVAFAHELKIDEPRDRENAIRVAQGDLVAPERIELADILADPGKFDGKRVAFIGFFHDEFEGRNVSVDEKASRKRSTKKSVWFDGFSSFAKLPASGPSNDFWVRVEGVFVKGPGGHFGMWPGSIERIMKFDSIPTPSK